MSQQADTPSSEKDMVATSKRLFLRGLAALLPTLVTLIILIKLIGFVHSYIGSYIGLGLTHATAWAMPEMFEPTQQEVDDYASQEGKPPSVAASELRSQAIEAVAHSWQMAVLGFFCALVIVCVVGFVLASFIGRRLWHALEETFVQLPVIKQIYPHVKQVTDYIFGERKLEFSRVVAVQYPRKGIWSLGLVTGPALGSLRELNKDYITIFIPSSPTPLTGYVITVLREDTIDVPISIEKALRFIISGGVINPGTELPTPGKNVEPTLDRAAESENSAASDQEPLES